jgi:transposase
MMVAGVDPHKQTHTAVAVDELGRKLDQKTVPARREGHLELLAWAHGLAGARELVFAVEDVRHVAGNLTRDLLGAGQRVVFVPPKMMAGERRGGRERGKSDPIDAQAIARLALRERDHLPAACLSERVRPVRLLADHRDHLVAERTRAINSLRWTVHDIDPALAPGLRALSRPAPCSRLQAALSALPASPARRIALSQLTRITTLTTEITSLGDDLTALVTDLVPALLDIRGIGPVTAARILGETGDIRRFTSPAAYARHNGTAPVPVSSGNRNVHRLSRAGNRQLNAAIHRAAIVQARCHPPAQALLQRRYQTTSETRKASLRVLKRHLSDAIYRALTTDAWRLTQPPSPAQQAG